ncbi:MAG: ABC transporter permease, partial [Candidatus Humimicrobiaceae bacterium]
MRKNIKYKYYPMIFFIVLLLIWETISRFEVFPPFILPSPSSIIVSLVTNFTSMQYDILITLYEAAAGFIIAIILSVVIAIAMDSIIGFKKTIYPVLIISQTVPIIIIAPLFIIWFGYGYAPKIIIVTL